MTYCLLGGSIPWQKACETSPLLGILRRMSVARDTSRRISVWLRTGAKQSDFSQGWLSRLPRTMMRYLQHCGLPFSSCLILEIAMVGRALPVTERRRRYSASVMTSQVLRFTKPLYSSAYALSHSFLSCGCRR